MNNSLKSPEILAPCGSYDILVAAVKAGADACYIGGNKFGARAYAANLSDDSVIAAIDYAHIHNVKLYLTVNTLFKNNEIQELYDYLAPYYEGGIDAVIVQDLGAFKFIRESFPGLVLHCSTQMNITSVYGAKLMKSLGASRIVTPREMSLSEIKQIKNSLDIEIESFVHGAMCYSYSGQCLMSSMAGGRSGNRGRCAQPCRKKYDGEYILSMKDMCTLDIIPQLVDAGIDSFKIEGRMKNEYYVASAVAAYKELVSDYVSGCFSTKKAGVLNERLASVYNRGGFCNGYFFRNNGPDMISKQRPNNQGVLIGTLCSAGKGEAVISLSSELNCHDVLELRKKDNTRIEVTTGKSGSKGQLVSIKVPDSKNLVINQKIYRTKCNKIIDELKTEILSRDRKIPITGELIGNIGEKMSLTLHCCDTNITVYSENVLEKSQKSQCDCKDISEKIGMLGNTSFSLTKLDIMLDSSAFVPAGIVKRLRREAIDLLTYEITARFRRNPADKKTFTSMDIDSEKEYSYPSCHVGIRNIEQLKEILRYNIQYIYVQRMVYDDIIATGLIKKISEKNIKIIIELPDIIKNDFALKEYLPKEYYGIYINNIDGYAQYIQNYEILSEKYIVIGSCLYAYNNIARDFLYRDNVCFENPKELKDCELLAMDKAYPCQLTVYEHQRVMLAAQCVTKNRQKCTGGNSLGIITDDMGNRFYTVSDCACCHGIIYNGIPTSLIGKLNKDFFKNINAESLKINFTVENEKEVHRIMDSFFKKNIPISDTTTGHLFRGVE